MTNEVVIGGIPDVTAALQLIAKRTRLSMTALINTGGVENGSLTSIGTGSVRAKDMALGPLFRVLRAVNWELAGRSKDPRGVIIKPEGGTELLVCGADGGRPDISVAGLQDLPILLNTVAAANGMTVTGVNRIAQLTGGSLVGIARRTSPNNDVRINGLIRFVEAAQFELLIRPVHETMRQARMAFATARRS